MDSLLCGVNDAARALGLGRTSVYKLISEGKIETVLLGRRRLIKAGSLHKLAETD